METLQGLMMRITKVCVGTEVAEQPSFQGVGWGFGLSESRVFPRPKLLARGFDGAACYRTNESCERFVYTHRFYVNGERRKVLACDCLGLWDV